MDSIVNVTSGNFESEVVKSAIPVLIDFWAPWCAPCRMMEPVLEQVAKEYNGKVKFCKLNVDEEPDLSSRYKIFNIPAFLVFSKGEIVNQRVGAGSKEAIVKLIEAFA
jgi:thioredoxin 1